MHNDLVALCLPKLPDKSMHTHVCEKGMACANTFILRHTPKMEVNINDFFVFGKSLRLEETALL